MKIKDGFVKCPAVEGWVAVSAGEDGNKIVKLNNTGSEIWDGIESGKSADEIADYFTEKYNLEKSKAIEYVETFIKEMRDGGLIEE